MNLRTAAVRQVAGLGRSLTNLLPLPGERDRRARVHNVGSWPRSPGAGVMGSGYRGSGHPLLRPVSCTWSQASQACPAPRGACVQGEGRLRAKPTPHCSIHPAESPVLWFLIPSPSHADSLVRYRKDELRREDRRCCCRFLSAHS